MSNVIEYTEIIVVLTKRATYAELLALTMYNSRTSFNYNHYNLSLSHPRRHLHVQIQQ